jgi:hypothetical protein
MKTYSIHDRGAPPLMDLLVLHRGKLYFGGDAFKSHLHVCVTPKSIPSNSFAVISRHEEGKNCEAPEVKQGNTLLSCFGSRL